MRASLALAAMMLLASACAQDEPAANRPASSPPGNLLAVSVSYPASGVAFYERTTYSVGPYESTVGAELVWASGEAHVAPYGTLAYYGARTSVTVEVFMPKLAPFLGSADRILTITTTYRW